VKVPADLPSETLGDCKTGAHVSKYKSKRKTKQANLLAKNLEKLFFTTEGELKTLSHRFKKEKES
jgi:hypothetical protein